MKICFKLGVNDKIVTFKPEGNTRRAMKDCLSYREER